MSTYPACTTSGVAAKGACRVGCPFRAKLYQICFTNNIETCKMIQIHCHVCYGLFLCETVAMSSWHEMLDYNASTCNFERHEKWWLRVRFDQKFHLAPSPPHRHLSLQPQPTRAHHMQTLNSAQKFRGQKTPIVSLFNHQRNILP